MRYALPATAALLTLTALVFLLGLVQSPLSASAEPPSRETYLPAYTFAEMRAVAQRSERLGEELLSARRFRADLAEIEAALWAGTVGAPEAADRARERSEELNPVYVQAARQGSPGLSEREAVMAVMLRGMQTQLDLLDASAERPPAVLEQLLCELSVDPDLSPELKRELSRITPCPSEATTLPGPRFEGE